MTKTTGRPASRRNFTPKTQEQRDQELSDIKDLLVQGVAGITNSDQWREYLKVASRFHSYSFGNIILAWMQLSARGLGAPTYMGSYKKWQEMGRYVRKGEKGLMIFAPVIVKYRPGDDGYDPSNPEKSRLVRFRVTRTWDYQQTDGEPLPEKPQIVYPDGEIPEGMWDAAIGFVKEKGFSFSVGDSGRADGFTRFDTKEIVVSERLKGSDARSTMTLIHEIAHSLLHDPKDFPDYQTHRGVAETEAESVAFIVGTYFGIDTGIESFQYVAGWSPDSDTIQKVGSRIMRTAREVIAHLEPLITHNMEYATDENGEPALF